MCVWRRQSSDCSIGNGSDGDNRTATCPEMGNEGKVRWVAVFKEVRICGF